MTLQSESINELAAALVECQYMLTGAHKDSTNPFFKSKYANLEACIEALREPLHANGLAVSQTTRITEHGAVLVTTLMHKSGQWIAGELPLSATKVNDPQAQGSAISYARRYTLMAVTGLVQTDDDGETAHGRPKSGTASTPSTSQKKPASTNTAAHGSTTASNAGASSQASSSAVTSSKSPSKLIEGEEPEAPPVIATPAQMSELSAIAKANGWTPEDVTNWIVETFQIQPENLRTHFTFKCWDVTCKWVKTRKPGVQA